jgi:hypothetical protein
MGRRQGRKHRRRRGRLAAESTEDGLDPGASGGGSSRRRSERGKSRRGRSWERRRRSWERGRRSWERGRRSRSREREERVGDGVVHARRRTREVSPGRDLGSDSASHLRCVHLRSQSRTRSRHRSRETSIEVVARRPAGFESGPVDVRGLNRRRAEEVDPSVSAWGERRE